MSGLCITQSGLCCRYEDSPSTEATTPEVDGSQPAAKKENWTDQVLCTNGNVVMKIYSFVSQTFKSKTSLETILLDYHVFNLSNKEKRKFMYNPNVFL